MVRRSLTALVAFAFVLLTVPLGQHAAASTSGIVISEFRFRGPAGGNDEFVELLNASASPVEVSGWKLQGCASTTGAASDRATIPAGITLAAGQHYLFVNTGTAGYSGAVAGDLGYSTGFSDGAGARIVTGAGAIVDGVGGNLVGGTQCREGAGITGMPGTNGDQSYERRSGGTQDTDDNAADFDGPKASDPQNRLSGSDTAPSITATSPIAGATDVAVDANILITFSEPVNVSAAWYSINCALSMAHTAATSGGPTTFMLDPDPSFTIGEGCTVTISAAQVSDQDTNDPPNLMATDHTFSFTVAAGPVEASVLISEVYGGGGNAGATYKNDFIELYNRTSTDASLAGWSVQYGSSAGTTWQVTPLTGTIAAGRNYLIQEAAGAGGTTPLPSPDVVGTIAMSATAGKVALVSSTTALIGACPVSPAIVDLVGYGAANCSETSPTAALNNTVSAQRKAGGAQDTGNNLNDFTVGAPDPHPGRDQAPAVASSVPAAGAAGVARDANVTITFSEPVTTNGTWYTIDCGASGAHGATPSGGPTTFTLDPSSNFLGDETCAVTVLAANVADQDGDDPPDTMAGNHVFTFQTIDVFTCGDPATLVHEIQGAGLASGMVGSAATIEGVVVGDYQATPSEFGGFYLQEESADSDDNALTSEGIFVFDNGFGIDVTPGDVVRVRGTVTEFFNLTQLGSVNALVKCSNSASVPPTAVSLPVASVNDLERFEGMLVSFDQTLTATEVFNLGRFGEVSLSGAGRLYTPTAVTTPGAAAIAQLAQNNRSRIILDDGNSQQNIDPTLYPQGGLTASNTLRVGDTLPSLTGVMDFRFSNYRIQPVGPITWSQTNPRTAAPAPLGGNLKIASFNVLNFFNGDGLGGGFPTSRGATSAFELQRQLAKEVSALTAINADIVGLMEIENDAGANSALAHLVAALNSAVGAGTYSYIDTGVIGTDEIKVALIYKTAAVTPVGAFKAITSAIDPTFIDTLNRPSLAQTFRHSATGQLLTIVVNHLKSKGSVCAGDPDTGDGQGNCNLTRTAAAAALARWLGTDPTGSGDPDYLIIGDLNSYTFEDPITTLTNNGYTNLVREFGGLTAYSYVFNGESGYLDHALATASLASQVTGVTDWHINPDEPTVLDYNVEFKTPNQVNTFYAPGPYRSSDHDPVIIGLHLNSAPTANANGPYSVGEGASVTLTASATDPDSDPLTYAWDLDNDGTFETPGQRVTFAATTIDGPATRTVKVRVSDGEDATVATTTVTVTNVAPTATAGGPYTGAPFAPVTFSGNATDPAGVADVLTYAWDFDYDGTFAPDASGVDLKSPSHAYAAPGIYRVALRVTDDDGGVATLAIATVSIGAPTATTGKIEGTPKWGDLLKTKIHVHSNATEITGRIEIEGDGWTYVSTRLDSIVVTGADAAVFGAFGSVTFRLDVHDGGDTGTDTLQLRTSDGYDSGVLTQPRGNLTVFAN